MSTLLEQASLVMIPSGYKEDIVYSQIPTNGNGDLSFTRASNGTRVNSAGLVEVCPWNLVEYSEQFDNAYWPKSDATITANAIAAPNGTTTADKFIATATNANHLINKAGTIPVILGQSYTFSLYAKAAEYSFVRVQLQASNFPESWANFNLSDGTIGLTTGVSGTIESVGNGWYRCSITQTATGTGNSGLQPFVLDSNRGTSSPSYTGNGTSGAFIWGAQLNIGSTAKPYFPTTDRLNVPRLTYQNGGGGCPSLLLEKQSTNLITYSEQFDNAVHYKLDVTITANNITSPDGTQNADKFTETTGTGEHIVYDIDSNATGTYTLSAFFKGGAGTIYPVLRLNGSSTTAYAGCIFNTSTGAVVNTFYNTYSAPITKVENMGNGWYRVSMTTTTTDANFGMRIAASNSTSPSVGAYGAISYTGSTSNYFYVWGAQLEASSYPTSYIPTTSSSATRVADDITNAFLQSGGFLGSATGAMFVSGTAYSLGQTVCNFVLTADNNTTKSFLFDTSGGNSIRIRTFDASSNAQSLTSGAITGNYKLCVSWTSSTIKFFLNGSLIGTISQTAYPYTTIKQESISFSNNIWNEVVFFPTNIADADAIALTS